MITVLKLVLVAVLLWTTPCSAFDLGDINLGTINKLTGMLTKAENLKEVSEPQEIQIGQGVASNLLGAAPLVNNAQLQKYVNNVGRWVALHTERPDLNWHFGVLKDDDINAFATPGGYIFITQGLFKKLNSESELAGVLAHEMAHVLKRHHLKAIQKNAQAGLLADVISLGTNDNRHSEALGMIINTGTQLYARGLDKSDEYEADRMGVIIAARSGYDPYGLPLVLQMLESMNAQDNSLALMFKTHPAPASRLTLLEPVMSSYLDQYATQPSLANRFSKLH